MSEKVSNTAALILWSTVLIVALTLFGLLSFNSSARASARSQAKHDRKEVLVLNAQNTLSIRSAVTESSMAKLSTDLLAMSRRLPSDAVIYLVLDTPGGEVNAGNQFLDIADAIPQRIDTITVFSASMGFHIAQHLGNRYVTASGRFMSHRIRVGGIGGQVPGEALSRMKDIEKLALRMDEACAKRMGLSVETYRDLTRDEYWVSGEDAVKEHAADKIILATCDESLSGNTVQTFETMFGEMKVEVSKCPLISIH